MSLSSALKNFTFCPQGAYEFIYTFSCSCIMAWW